jgi:hypothetical protein
VSADSFADLGFDLALEMSMGAGGVDGAVSVFGFVDFMKVPPGLVAAGWSPASNHAIVRMGFRKTGLAAKGGGWNVA